MTDQQIVKKDIEELYLGNLGTVEFDLELPEVGKNGSKIEWHSGNLYFMDHTGKVSRPSYGRGNREVELTAKFSYGEYEEEKVYLVTVLEENNKIEVSEIYPIKRCVKPSEKLYLPGAVSVKTKDGRVIAHFVEWENGQCQSWEEAGEYTAKGCLKDTVIPLSCEVCVCEKGGREKEEVVIASERAKGIVRLLPGSDFYDAQRRVLSWLLNTDADQWLYNFRQAAGLPVGKEKPLTGWDSPEGLLRGHTTGHYLSSLALCYNVTGDEDILAKANYMVDVLKECQDAFEKQEGYHKGFLSAYSEEQFDLLEVYTPYPKIWAPYYTLHKILAGLIDLYNLAGIEKAGVIAQGIGDWVYERLSRLPHEQRVRMWSIYIAGEYGGMNESMAELYRMTGKEEYLETARFFDNDRLFFPLEQNVDALDGMHANQHIPQMVGAIKMYEMSGEKKYYTIASRFWDIVTGSHAYAIGGTGESEMFHAAGDIAGLLTKSTSESCATYNMLKLTAELFRYQPDVTYMDYYERAVLNHILSSCDHEATSGSTYFLSMRPKAEKDFDASENSCCHGTGLESHFKYGENIYFEKDGDILVNLFIPSVLDMSDKGCKITQTSSETNPGRINFSVEAEGEWALRIRKPYWSDETTKIFVNGECIEAEAENGYFAVARNWSGITEVVVEFSCKLRYEVSPDKADYYVLCYGPYVLAALTEQEDVLSLAKGNPEEDFAADAERPLAFINKETNLTFIPLEKVWKEEYQVYICEKKD